MIAQPIHEPFHDLQRQKDAARFGMWVFLASEMLFFGALILGFTVYRHLHPDAMREAARENERPSRHAQHRRSPDEQPDHGCGRQGGGA